MEKPAGFHTHDHRRTDLRLALWYVHLAFRHHWFGISAGWLVCQPGCWVDGIEQTARHHFSVQWGNYGSMTAWTGTCDASGGVPAITTVWHLVRTGSQYSWDHMLTNSDVFVPK